MAMRHLFALAALTLVACAEGNGAPAKAPQSACRSLRFEGSGFIVCSPVNASRLHLFAARRDEPPRRRFKNLGLEHSAVAFAMNAGMYGVDRRPIGLTIVDGRPVHRISLRASGGNFGMKPNGVFLVRRSGKAEVVVSEAFKPNPDILLATQSGPMLVIAGKLHPKFDHDGESRSIRNGVGIAPDGGTRFVISKDPVSLGKFARFFRDELKARNALFFDGAVSALWDPANHRRDITVDLGPMVVVFKPAESAPGREAPATP